MTKTDREPPQPYGDECGCIHTTEAEVQYLGLFDRRFVSRVKKHFCPTHRQRHQAEGDDEISTYRVACKWCRWFFWMGIVAWAGWLATAIALVTLKGWW